MLRGVCTQSLTYGAARSKQSVLVSAGLEDRQQQFVRYAGQMEAKKVEDGWLMGESEAAYKRVHGAQSGPGFNPKNCLPQQVQLTVTSAPAEFCLPMKNDRQFKPHFQVQVSPFTSVHNQSS